VDSDDPRWQTIRYALQAQAERRLTVDETLAAIASALAEPPREQIMAEMRELEAAGRGREAAGILARRYCDPADARAVDNFKRKLRDWRQKNGDASV
jgi:hypothetical protein